MVAAGVVAYAALAPAVEDGALRVVEACAADAGAARGLCAALAAHARGAGAQRIALLLSPAHLVGAGRAPAGRRGADPCRARGGMALAGVVDLPPPC